MNGWLCRRVRALHRAVPLGRLLTHRLTYSWIPLTKLLKRYQLIIQLHFENIMLIRQKSHLVFGSSKLEVEIKSYSCYSVNLYFVVNYLFIAHSIILVVSFQKYHTEANNTIFSIHNELIIF